MKPVISKKQWTMWDKEQKQLMDELKLSLKNNSGIMAVTLKRAFQIAEERKYQKEKL